MRSFPVHNDRMNRVLARSLALLMSAAVLAGCSGSDDKKDPEPGTTSSDSSTRSTPQSTSASPYIDGVPDGIELTAPGSRLSVGDSAVVAWKPGQNASVGVFDYKVTRLEKTTFKKSFVGWKLDDATKKSTPYFVHLTVKNVGEADTGGREVFVYIADATGTLISQSTFASKFKPCPSTPLPDKFKPGAKTKVCLVFLAPDHGELKGVSFRPTEQFDPIVWTGDVQSPKSDKPGKGKHKNKHNG